MNEAGDMRLSTKGTEDGVILDNGFTLQLKCGSACSAIIIIDTKIMSKKTVVSVELLCSKCKQKVMKLIASVEGITSIVLDPAKNTVTVVGEADPVRIIKRVRKFRKSASIVSIGPPKEEKKDEKKEVKKDDNKKDEKKVAAIPHAPNLCHRCVVWYVIPEDNYGYCSIM
ncbi:hypothetical protein RIF29_06160 [Crotalaria pallida]|uniref:HMA domain-containing protein n=1 Tax=Crotalaria pallida TaxID=3830 RepID=A0AAN9J2W9_CROPI